MRLDSGMPGQSAESLIDVTRCRLSDGRVKEETLTTRRRRALGELINLPTSADGTSRAGSGYLWCVSSIEEHADPLIDATLVLDFGRPHPDQK
jgi:hypothetical protein